ncbi:MAG: hypothetical protein COU29_03935 [Candidatus Magasanikbacteria bacterium CG10_big_fil_rev_8_21_14_0_10_36_32]|uniref:Glycosyltransferase 2-like domain-containing protein n=1 Tax=Candidatus Magasanikbacteria bacterium CG10_big_fil_rev_8_21_14_0_10_36_32 TaxID=1974646 RepID=A0A2M6W5T2_9BACT|nr:MAG: hypothetical protein COU29_03935 [Candidatus Magasanikbacteria bacterium CG10_big_fil_rev_8_21_14_0_10_36_32]
MKKENFSDLSIYTTTLYKEDKVSKLRQKLAARFLENAANLGVRCIIVDGGSNEKFLNKVHSYKNVELVIIPKLKMGISRRKALKLAVNRSDTSYFLWSEPEKYDLIRPISLKKMIWKLRKNTADIVVPRRLSKNSYPKLQAQLETKANAKAKELMGDNFKLKGELDLWFGPKMFNRTGANFFLNYKGRLDKWDVIIKPVILAFQKGKRICSVDVDYTHDILQSSAETGDKSMETKRLEQYMMILAELENKFK